jgi:8-oxo-dGTP pyrophosphatase MutT (NUDIX family)
MAEPQFIGEPFQAAFFLYDEKGRSVLLHKRDGNTTINPNKWALFGGRAQEGETDVACCLREVSEEIGLLLQPDDILRLRRYLNTGHNLLRVVFFARRAVSTEDLTLGEGAGFAWIRLDDVQGLDLTEQARDDLRHFIEHIVEN